MATNTFKLRLVSAFAAFYSNVNPVVAVFLGWLLAGEVVTPRMLLAMLVIIVAVVLIVGRQGEAARQSLLRPVVPQAAIEDGLRISQ